jgi:hypothetical protein
MSCNDMNMKMHDIQQDSAVSSEIVRLSCISVDTYRIGIALCLSIRIIHLSVLLGVYDTAIPQVEALTSILL